MTISRRAARFAAASFGDPSRWRLEGLTSRLRHACALLPALLALGCATAPRNDFHPELAMRVFAVAYRDIEAIYVEETDPLDLLLAGLSGLEEIEPRLSIAAKDDRITVSMAGRPLTAVTTSAQWGSRDWASLTFEFLARAREGSEVLRAADAETLYAAVFTGMLAQFDDFSRYVQAEEARRRQQPGSFGSIGVGLEQARAGARILFFSGTDAPAYLAGLREGDVVSHIDGRPVADQALREIVFALRGPPGSRVQLTVERAGRPEPLLVSVVRKGVVLQSVDYRTRGKIAHIRIVAFHAEATEAVREAVQRAERELGEDLQGILLDLRNNQGGLLKQGISVADLFRRSGRIAFTSGRHRDSGQYFDADPEAVAENLPLAVLINGESAGSAEIVAAALQDSGRAVVVGTASFGHGTVQNVRVLPNEGQLILTWAHYHAPSGYKMVGRGVLPDICTSGGGLDADAVVTRLKSGRLPIDRAALERDVDFRDEAGILAVRALCPPRLDEDEVDLEVAARLLADKDLYARALGLK